MMGWTYQQTDLAVKSGAMKNCANLSSAPYANFLSTSK